MANILLTILLIPIEGKYFVAECLFHSPVQLAYVDLSIFSPFFLLISSHSFLLSLFFFPVALRPKAGQGLLILEVPRSHTTTHHSR